MRQAVSLTTDRCSDNGYFGRQSWWFRKKISQSTEVLGERSTGKAWISILADETHIELVTEILLKLALDTMYDRSINYADTRYNLHTSFS